MANARLFNPEEEHFDSAMVIASRPLPVLVNARRADTPSPMVGRAPLLLLLPGVKSAEADERHGPQPGGDERRESQLGGNLEPRVSSVRGSGSVGTLGVSERHHGDHRHRRLPTPRPVATTPFLPGFDSRANAGGGSRRAAQRREEDVWRRFVQRTSTGRRLTREGNMDGVEEYAHRQRLVSDLLSAAIVLERASDDEPAAAMAAAAAAESTEASSSEAAVRLGGLSAREFACITTYIIGGGSSPLVVRAHRKAARQAERGVGGVSGGGCSDAAPPACGETCSICMRDFEAGERVKRLPCGAAHHFHECCVRQWLVRSAQCPLCRADVSDRCASPEKH